jgi:hypothetical protein
MSVRSSIILLATIYDVEEVTACDNCTNIDLMNRFLLKEYPDTRPQIKALSPLDDAFGENLIRNLDEDGLVLAFRQIPWFEPKNTLLLIQKDGDGPWKQYKVREE